MIFDLPEIIVDLITARNGLREYYAAADRKFTLDGKLVGDIGEAIAMELFGIELSEQNDTGVDGYAPDNRSVQVKTTGTGRGPSFRNVETRADHLLFFDLDFEKLKGEIVYNGPEEIALRNFPATWLGQMQVTSTQIRAADALVEDAQRLPPVGGDINLNVVVDVGLSAEGNVRPNKVTEIETRDRIAVLRINRPEKLNAITVELAQAITRRLVQLDADPAVDGIVLTGAGERAFCAGVDLNEARDIQVHEIEDWFGAVCNIYRQILMTNKPVIAALNGVAAGAGFQMALVSDQRVAHDGIRMGQPEINAGIPSIMGSYWMSLHLGWSINQELSMTGRLMDAAEARGLGLINHLVEREAVIAKACEVAESFAGKPAVAWRRTKARFREVAMSGFDEAFRAGVLGQQEAFANSEPQALIDRFLARD